MNRLTFTSKPVFDVRPVMQRSLPITCSKPKLPCTQCSFYVKLMICLQFQMSSMGRGCASVQLAAFVIRQGRQLGAAGAAHRDLIGLLGQVETLVFSAFQIRLECNENYISHQSWHVEERLGKVIDRKYSASSRLSHYSGKPPTSHLWLPMTIRCSSKRKWGVSAVTVLSQK